MRPSPRYRFSFHFHCFSLCFFFFFFIQIATRDTGSRFTSPSSSRRIRTSPDEKVIRLAGAAFCPGERQITVKRPRRVINANRVTCCKLSLPVLDTGGKKDDMQMGACSRNRRIFSRILVIFNQTSLVSSLRHGGGYGGKAIKDRLKCARKGACTTRARAHTPTYIRCGAAFADNGPRRKNTK